MIVCCGSVSVVVCLDLECISSAFFQALLLFTPSHSHPSARLDVPALHLSLSPALPSPLHLFILSAQPHDQPHARGVLSSHTASSLGVREGGSAHQAAVHCSSVQHPQQQLPQRCQGHQINNSHNNDQQPCTGTVLGAALVLLVPSSDQIAQAPTAVGNPSSPLAQELIQLGEAMVAAHSESAAAIAAAPSPP